MRIHCDIGSRRLTADLDAAIDISIPLDFSGAQPNSYDLPPARATAWQQGGWVGDTRRGGSCNFDEVRLVAHCNGTHTECVGHISEERIAILETLPSLLIPCTLITMEAVPGIASGDGSDPSFERDDRVISRAVIEQALGDADPDFLGALVIRTLPNDASKLRRRYADQPAPYFSREAMELIRQRNVGHLLVDIPSLDRAYDDGKLTAHHIYWDVPAGSHEVRRGVHSPRTVTEFIHVPGEVADGSYLLNLQIAPWKLDAAPSRPVLIPVRNAS